MTFSILAQLKGRLLVKCELPADLQEESNDILGWVLPLSAIEAIEVRATANCIKNYYLKTYPH